MTNTTNHVILGPVPTHTTVIFCGFKNLKTGHTCSYEELAKICQDYVDAAGFCVSLRMVDYIYTKGREWGISVTLINYPRFPSTPEAIRQHAMTLAEKLRVAAQQDRVTVIDGKETVTLQDANIPGPASAQPRSEGIQKDPHGHITEFDVCCLRDHLLYKRQLTLRDRETVEKVCRWYLEIRQELQKGFLHSIERIDQLELQLRGAVNDKRASGELADYREKQVIRLTKRIAELEWAIAEMAKKIWWPRIRSLARFVLNGSSGC